MKLTANADLLRLGGPYFICTFIIPGHDPLVFAKFPEVAEGIVQIRD